ncbi:MAG: hypothetical protein HUN04_25775 [Desulfobacter sp.]|nr:MAG: hypothetical protein HUN04_25775 [Desulfobacter sp.]
MSLPVRFLSRLILVAAVFLAMGTGPQRSAWAGTGLALSPWKIIITRFTLIKYKSREDLERFHTSVKFGPVKWNRPLALETITGQQLEEMVREKVDAVFERAAEILDMKKRFAPVNVNLHSGTASLKRAYERIYSGECRLRAWYRFKTNTVYLNVRDLHEGILAHELAHSIIDHYLAVRPPSQTAEILARYVDSHLARGFISN